MGQIYEQYLTLRYFGRALNDNLDLSSQDPSELSFGTCFENPTVLKSSGFETETGQRVCWGMPCNFLEFYTLGPLN